jgi:hypothetical protein
MLKSNNILSYFIKDIKDPSECAFYKQQNKTNVIKIFYKDKILYELIHNKLKPESSWNYKTNIIIEYVLGRIINYKIDSIKTRNFKALFYKKNWIILKSSGDYIMYGFIYNKYLIKNYFDYVAELKSLLYTRIEYYNGHIYKYISISIYKNNCNHKYKHVQILIMNKYELHYINRFFNLFFVKNY